MSIEQFPSVPERILETNENGDVINEHELPEKNEMQRAADAIRMAVIEYARKSGAELEFTKDGGIAITNEASPYLQDVLVEHIVKEMHAQGVNISADELADRMYDEQEEDEHHDALFGNKIGASSGHTQVTVMNHKLCGELLYRTIHDEEFGNYDENTAQHPDPSAPSFFDTHALARALEKLKAETMSG